MAKATKTKKRPARASPEQIRAQTPGRKQAAKQKRLRRELTRIGEYLISGGIYFWSGYAVFFVCDAIFGWSLWWAKLTANFAGWSVNYMLQRYWVFRNPRLAKHQAQVTGRYMFLMAVNFLLDFFIVYGLQTVGISPYIGQFISAGFFTVWNYIWYKTWVFSTHLHGHFHRRHHKRVA